MTLLVAYKSHGMPMLVGDAMCGFFENKEFQRLMLRKKVYLIATNLAVGWTGSALSARFVVSALLKEFEGKTVSSADLELLLINLKFDDMSHLKVKILGWIIDQEPKCFMWESDNPSRVLYADHYYDGSGRDFWKTLVTSRWGHGGDPPRDGSKFSEELGAVQEALSYCGEAFFQEIGTGEDWRESFGFAYEVIVFAYGRFFPLGNTAFVEWQYVWNNKTQTGTLNLGHFLAKLNFREHYSVLQKAQHTDLKIQRCRNYPIKPIYDYDIQEKLTFPYDLNADHYVHFLVCNLPEGQIRVPYVCGKTQAGDKIWLRSEDGKARFEVNNARFDEIFRPTIAKLKEQH